MGEKLGLFVVGGEGTLSGRGRGGEGKLSGGGRNGRLHDLRVDLRVDEKLGNNGV